MVVPEHLWRFDTATAVDSLARRFGLPNDPGMQDWPWEVANPDRLDEFLAAYEDAGLGDDERFTLMEMIIQSFEDLGPAMAEDPRWERTLEAIDKGIELHAHTVWYWAAVDTENPDEQWLVTPFLRKILKKHRHRLECDPCQPLCSQEKGVQLEVTISLKPYEIGCEPSPSVPSETLVQDGWSTYLLFQAISKTKDEQGCFTDLGVAVLECEGCVSAKFGYPNDEGLPEHPLYGYGMENAFSSVIEVSGSPWAREVAQQLRRSEERIWSGKSAIWKPAEPAPLKHFIIPLKEKTFECVANDLRVVLFAGKWADAIAYVNQKLSEH